LKSRAITSSFAQEFTYAFGGCTIVSGLEGSYLSKTGTRIPDRINLIYADVPLALSTNFDHLARYTSELREVSLEALSEESVLVAATQVYHGSDDSYSSVTEGGGCVLKR
jgi:hypothetical protein